ncbi:unnamed protein product [Cuscuta europaea]|uniref:Uncharacterized protein n=1 Tax=Cuscuta europaea TaxID=41803 RepID=A0A9P1ENM5_CUSEU|nr:unnamed protein product [Cuscuta europaea]
MMAREDLQWSSSPQAKLSEVHLNQLDVKLHRMEDKARCSKRRSAEPQETECGGQSAEGGARNAECGAAQDEGQTAEPRRLESQPELGRRRVITSFCFNNSGIVF